jgi:hypothetical protein
MNSSQFDRVKLMLDLNRKEAFFEPKSIIRATTAACAYVAESTVDK